MTRFQAVSSLQTPSPNKRTTDGQIKFPITEQGTTRGESAPLPPTPTSSGELTPSKRPVIHLEGKNLISPPDTPLALRFKRVKLSPPEEGCLPLSVEPTARDPHHLSILSAFERVDPKTFAIICSYLQPGKPDAPHHIYLPHAEDGRREYLRRWPTAFTSIPYQRSSFERPNGQYKCKRFSRTVYGFEEQEKDWVRRRAWPLLLVSLTLRRRFIDEIFTGHSYLINILDAEALADLVAAPAPQNGLLRRLQFRNISVFVPEGKMLPPLPLAPFFIFAKEEVLVKMELSPGAEASDPAQVMTIKRVYDFMVNFARVGSSLPLQYENVYAFRGGDVYVKPSSAYTKRYGTDRIPRSILPHLPWAPPLHALRADLEPLYTFTGSPIWLDMRCNIYNTQHEYPDPSEGYEQWTAEDVGLMGSYIDEIRYMKGLGNHIILNEEAFSVSNTHFIYCVHIPLKIKISRRSHLRLFPCADTDIHTEHDGRRSKLYEIVNSRGIYPCGMLCRGYIVGKLEKKIVSGELTFKDLEDACLSCGRGSVMGYLYRTFCWTAEKKAEFAKWNEKVEESTEGSAYEDDHEPGPDPEYDGVWTASESEASSEKDGIDDEIQAKEGAALSDSSTRPAIPKPLGVRRAPEGYKAIQLDACSDTSSLAGDGNDEFDDEDRETTASSLSGSGREDKTRDTTMVGGDRKYESVRPWEASELLHFEESDGESDEEMHSALIDLDELAELKLEDDEETQAYLQTRAKQLSYLALAKKDDVDMADEPDGLSSSEEGTDVDQDLCG